MSRLGVGIDYGTSNSAAAWFDGTKVHLVPLETDSIVMPTACHLDRSLAVKTGQEAVRQYIDENRDRIVELTPEVIAKSQLLVDEGGGDPFAKPDVSTVDVYGAAVIDRGLPGRLFRGVKRLLGSAEVRRLMVFDSPFRLVALVTPILLRIRKAIERELPGDLESLSIGRPVRFEGDEQGATLLALDRMAEAATYAGFKSSRFYPEPLAATLSYLHAKSSSNAEPGQSPESEGVALTFDFGGGTLDLSLVRYAGTSFDVLATKGLPKGGDHIDQLLFEHYLFPALGQGLRWSRRIDGTQVETDFPFKDFESLLLNWPVTYTLNQNRYRSKIKDCMDSNPEAFEPLKRLDELITHNYSYLVFQAIREAKAKLSEQASAVIDIPELDLAIPLTRASFEMMLAPLLDEINALIESVLEDAKLTPAEVSLVIRTGGSSLIASVCEQLNRMFPGKVVEHDPFTSVAEGLAIASFHGYEFD